MTVRPTFYRVNMSEILLITLPILALIAFAYWLKFQFVRPAPPQTITITTGGEAGGYHTFAKRYAQILARSNITLDLRPSAGSIENLARIRDERTDTDLALLQGGIATANDAPELMSIGRLFYEPLWVFYRGADTLDRLSQAKRQAPGDRPRRQRHASPGDKSPGAQRNHKRYRIVAAALRPAGRERTRKGRDRRDLS